MKDSVVGIREYPQDLGGATFVIADLQGRLDLLELAYDRIIRHASSSTIIHLGDYIDRGPRSRQIIAGLMNDATIPLGFKRTFLKGTRATRTLRATGNIKVAQRLLGHADAAAISLYYMHVTIDDVRDAPQHDTESRQNTDTRRSKSLKSRPQHRKWTFYFTSARQAV